MINIKRLIANSIYGIKIENSQKVILFQRRIFEGFIQRIPY
jgi:type III secretory pathway lipoprotein EscJ